MLVIFFSKLKVFASLPACRGIHPDTYIAPALQLSQALSWAKNHLGHLTQAFLGLTTYPLPAWNLQGTSPPHISPGHFSGKPGLAKTRSVRLSYDIKHPTYYRQTAAEVTQTCIFTHLPSFRHLRHLLIDLK